MSEYRLVLPKTAQGGFAESPEQVPGNAGSPSLDSPLTIKNTLVIAAAVSAGRKVFGAGYTATVDQIGNSRLDEAVAYTGKALQYGGMLVFGPVGIGLAAVTAAAEGITLGITTAVNNHAIDLDNSRIRAERGTRVELGVKSYG